MIIQEFDLTIKHRSGKSNANADALSWNPVPEHSEDGSGSADVLAVEMVEEAVDLQWKEIAELQEKDGGVLAVIW